eukprot:4521367-Pyramimonas_sp.AAC.1
MGSSTEIDYAEHPNLGPLVATCADIMKACVSVVREVVYHNQRRLGVPDSLEHVLRGLREIAARQQKTRGGLSESSALAARQGVQSRSVHLRRWASTSSTRRLYMTWGRGRSSMDMPTSGAHDCPRTTSSARWGKAFPDANSCASRRV